MGGAGSRGAARCLTGTRIASVLPRRTMSGAPLSSRQAASGEPPFRRERKQLKIVIFSGGRGSSVLSQELLRDSRISLTLAINGYDDGLSTGEVRRFLGDALGPSDFRKNASHLARALHTCGDADIELLDRRLPSPCTRDQALAIFRSIEGPVRA